MAWVFGWLGVFQVLLKLDILPASASQVLGLQVCAITSSRELFCCRSESPPPPPPRENSFFDEPRLELSQGRAKQEPDLEMGSSGGRMPRKQPKGQTETLGPPFRKRSKHLPQRMGRGGDSHGVLPCSPLYSPAAF